MHRKQPENSLTTQAYTPLALSVSFNLLDSLAISLHLCWPLTRPENVQASRTSSQEVLASGLKSVMLVIAIKTSHGYISPSKVHCTTPLVQESTDTCNGGG